MPLYKVFVRLRSFGLTSGEFEAETPKQAEALARAEVGDKWVIESVRVDPQPILVQPTTTHKKQAIKMNNARRKVLNAKLEEILKHKAAIEAVRSALDDIKNEIEEVKDEEQETHDNMPESLQQGEKGQQSEEAISELENAISALETVESELETAESSLETATQ